VGAGRGPLVDRVLRAAASVGQKVDVYAIEKNPNAIVTLQLRKQKEWGNQVQLVHTDMRYWNTSKKCNIMVSELLGSFGDNELSPECLDGAEKLLDAHGVCIPTKYTSYIAPLSSSILFNKTALLPNQKYRETPMVVRFRQVYEISRPRPVWEFNHPNNEQKNPPGHPNFNIHNTRYSCNSFSISQDTVIHGFSAYFDCVLYKDVVLSILPETHSKDMTSWFSMYFPIKVFFNLT
jgi:protein arginine N-methyltransferase 5